MKKTILHFSLAMLVTCLLGVTANAQVVLFSGTDGSLDLDLASGSITQDGLEITLSANDGVVNATATGLGINDSATGDDTDGLDTINLVEILTISFDLDVTFNWIDLAGVGSNDGLRFSFNGGTPIDVTSSGVTNFDTPLLAGQTLTITAFEPNAPTENNGVNIESFQVTIPEPTSAALLLGALGLTVFRRRR